MLSVVVATVPPCVELGVWEENLMRGRADPGASSIASQRGFYGGGCRLV